MSAIREVALEKEVGELQAEVERLREALSSLIRRCEEHDAAVAFVIGRPPNWTDSYLDEARAALRGER